MKVVIGNVYSNLSGEIDKAVLGQIEKELSVKTPGYFFTPAYRNGWWDGYTRFFDKRSNSFPTGLLPLVLNTVENLEIEDTRDLRDINCEDNIQLFEPDTPGGVITLRDYQMDAVKAALRERRGIVNVATNGGKTEIASGIIKQILPHLRASETILFLTHSKEIFHQSASRIEKRLGITVGRVGDGVWDVKPVTLVMIPTVSKYIKKPTEKTVKYTKEAQGIKLLVNLLEGNIAKGLPNRRTMEDAYTVITERVESDETKKFPAEEAAIEILSQILPHKKTNDDCLSAFLELKKTLKGYQDSKIKEELKKHERVLEFLESAFCIIGDEVHHASSSTWYDTLMLCKNAVFRIGLTGTVDRKDKVTYMRLMASMSEPITRISNDFLIKQGYSAKPTIYLEPIQKPVISRTNNWQEAYKKGIVENEYRNQKIVERVVEKYKEGKGCLIIVQQVRHGEILKKMLDKLGIENEFTHGSRSSEERISVLNDMKKGELKVLIATSILDEGVDVSGIHCLWMGSGGKSFRQILQRVGRGLRKKEDGSGLEVYDFLDLHNSYLAAHTRERYQYYKDEKFEIRKLD